MSAIITEIIEKNLAIAAMLRLMVSYAKYIIELPNVKILISLSLGSNTMPIKNMVAIKINKSRYKEVPFRSENY